MKRIFGAILIAAGVLAVAWGEFSGAQSGRVIYQVEIRGTINPASSDYLLEAIGRANSDGAQALIVELDTPGGLVSSVREMAQAIDRSQVPVVVYVSPAGAAATSAGALLMLASHVSAMAPGTNIGAAHPVGAQGEDVKGAAGEKAVNDVAAFARGLAEVRGRNRDLAEQVVSKSSSLTSEEALKQKLVDLEAKSLPDLFAALEGRKVRTQGGDRTIHSEGAEVRKIAMSRGQKLLHLIAHPNIAAILMTLGMMLIYVEVSNPGITIAGALGGVCLLVAFMAFQVLPIRIGGIALVLLGSVLMMAELFVPTHGALAGGGVLSFVLGLLWVLDPSKTDLRVDSTVLVAVGLGLGSGVAFIGIAAARTRSLSRQTLARIGGGSNLSGLAGYEGVVETLEAEGRSGKVLVRGEVWDFQSDAPLQVGERVRVDRMDGFKAHVRRL